MMVNDSNTYTIRFTYAAKYAQFYKYILPARIYIYIDLHENLGPPGPQRAPSNAARAAEVIVQMSCCDGSTAAVAGNAAHLALLDAGVAMKATAMCVALGVTWEALVMGEDGDLGKMARMTRDELVRKQLLQDQIRFCMFLFCLCVCF